MHHVDTMLSSVQWCLWVRDNCRTEASSKEMFDTLSYDNYSSQNERTQDVGVCSTYMYDVHLHASCMGKGSYQFVPCILVIFMFNMK